MFEKETIIHNRYKIESVLDKGRMANTYLAKNIENDELVVIKIVQLQGLKEWKILELFEREAKILKNLNYPRIPKYIDYFIEEKDNDIIYFLVYEYIKGTSLENMLQNGLKFDYEAVEKILRQVLEILDYLHNQAPSVIHRDIKPNNIIMKDKNEVYLVDFGAVQDTLASTESMARGSTFVGTFGYMPMEQLLGKATPQSDIYALGMTAIKLLTGKNPSQFKMKNLKPVYKEGKVLNHFDRIINLMIEPDIQNRVKSAKRVLYFLNNKTEIDKYCFVKEDINFIENNPTSRLSIRTFGDMVSLKVNSINKFENRLENGLTKSTIGFLLNHSWILMILGAYILFRFRIHYFSYFLLLLFLLPMIGRGFKKIYYRYGDVLIQIDKKTIFVLHQFENPIFIKHISDIYIKRNTVKDKTNLDIEITYYNKQMSIKKNIYMTNLTSEDAEFVSTFLIKNIEKRKEFLK